MVVRPLRIAHVTATFPPYYGGTGQVCYHNALELARRGHEVTVFTAAHPPGEFAYPPEITVKRLPVLLRFGNAPVLPGLFGLRGFDLIHLHFPFYFGAEAVTLAARLRHIPLVITYHQDVLLQGAMGAASRLHDSTLGAASLRSAACVLFTTLDYAQASQARWLLQRQPQKVGELPNGVDVQRFNPTVDGSTLRRQFGIGPQTVVLLLVAGLDRAHYFKGVSVLLGAMQQLAASPVHLLIVGDGDLRPQYEAEAARLGLAGRVSFVGRVSGEALPGYYAAAGVCVLPSWTMGEAFGVVLLEAMASGKPVVASRLPGVRAVVGDGAEGLLAQPGDAKDLAGKLRQLAEQPELRSRMGSAGRAKVEAQYAWPRVVDRLEDIYADVTAQPARVTPVANAHAQRP